MMRRLGWARLWAAAFVATAAACGDDDAPSSPPPTGGSAPGGGAPMGGAGGDGGEAGSGGVASPGRGDPTTFPTDCLATCEEACARLADCGGAASPWFPLEQEECLSRCTTSEGGAHWGDNSAHFKCCTSQEECADVAQCGGWLAHPDAVDSCARYCECRELGAVRALTAGHAAPEGYRFAPDLLMVDTGKASLDFAELPGARLVRDGQRKLVRLEPATPSTTVAALARLGRLLPTFVDSAGRISAASGDLVLVVDDPTALPRALEAASARGVYYGRELAAQLTSRPAARLHLLRGADAWQTLDLAAELSTMPGVTAELDQIRRYEKRYKPHDPLFPQQWHLENSGQNGSTPSVDGRVSEAWDITRGSPDVLVAINDDGVDLGHPEFSGKLDEAMGFPDDWLAQMGQGQFGSHGTSVAGVAAALANNERGGAGVCPDCRILPHLLGESDGGSFNATDAEVAQGFTDMVDAGASVINNSWGYETGDPTYVQQPIQFPPLASVVRASFDYAETVGRGGLGTVILFAAGNSNDVLDPLTAYETNVSVSAVDDLGLKPYYSSFGPDNDIAAPTNGGLNAITTTAPNSDYTTAFGGTSSACPFATGVVGLVLSAAPELTAAEVRALLAATATKIDPVFGQWDGEGHSDFHGAGLVNAYAAVALASGACTTAEECVAPSDDCGAECAVGTQCDTCRTARDCAEGYVCQALPSLGELVCVAEKGSGSCANGTVEVNGYCLPLPATCDVCPGTEQCNGRDDDCNGQADEGAVCTDGALCFIDGPGCGEGQACVGRRCAAACSESTDCPSGQACQTLKDQYGAAPGPKACVSSWASSCAPRCEVRASTLDDAGLAAFVACMEDGAADCSMLDTCRELLPQSI